MLIEYCRDVWSPSDFYSDHVFLFFAYSVSGHYYAIFKKF